MLGYPVGGFDFPCAGWYDINGEVDYMPASKKQIDQISAYQKANNEQILIKPRKEDRISERIQVLIEQGKTTSKQAYIIQAVKKQLEADGLPVDFDRE